MGWEKRQKFKVIWRPEDFNKPLNWWLICLLERRLQGIGVLKCRIFRKGLNSDLRKMCLQAMNSNLMGREDGFGSVWPISLILNRCRKQSCKKAADTLCCCLMSKDHSAGLNSTLSVYEVGKWPPDPLMA
ncbi:hypothetical protein CEXT_596401 [Caerostris extrusa]|uniref:Reverse transcriptase n=1 Tax=Caerostris extrusa TaxID=172846 RepID=A0AAV4TK59_CAEEX|nr:hypothetical protein CEXT_596401 [Caerostris extrusa]